MTSTRARIRGIPEMDAGSGDALFKMEIIVRVLYRTGSLIITEAAICGNLSGSRWFTYPTGGKHE